nr:MAG TPA: hypothetical protein [Caudoviricetes sp.]
MQRRRRAAESGERPKVEGEFTSHDEQSEERNKSNSFSTKFYER